MRLSRTALLLALALGLLATGCGGSDGESAATSEAATTEATTGPAETGCKTVDAPEPKADGGQTAPKAPLAAQKRYELVVTTSCGSFTIKLDQGVAPKTAASLVKLAADGFYDGTTFHRVVPGFVIQGGDPTGTGAGGPGYTTIDVPPDNAKYVEGVVAMAKGGAEPRGASGSQFFVVTGEDAGLPPDYAVVGFVTEGLDTVLKIDSLGVGDGPPSQTVVIEKVTVRES